MTIIPDLETAIVMTIPFLVTYAALHFILFKPLYAYLMERDHVVHQAKEETHELDERIEKQMGTLQQKLAAAREEAGAVRKQARHEAHAQEAAIIAKAKAEADALVHAAVAEIGADQQAASRVMQAGAAELSHEIAKQVLGREVSA